MHLENQETFPAPDKCILVRWEPLIRSHIARYVNGVPRNGTHFILLHTLLVALVTIFREVIKNNNTSTCISVMAKFPTLMHATCRKQQWYSNGRAMEKVCYGLCSRGGSAGVLPTACKPYHVSLHFNIEQFHVLHVQRLPHDTVEYAKYNMGVTESL